MPPLQGRTWAGTSLDERRAARRERLLDAALDLLGRGETVSVRAVCRGAQLTERYFYESFADRDELAVAAYERASQEALAAVAQAVAETDGTPEVVARAAVERAVEMTVDDPARGRALIVAPMTNPVLSAKREELAPLLTGLIGAQLPPTTPEPVREMAAIGIAGAMTSLFHAYLTGALAVSRPVFVEHCVQTLLEVGSRPRRTT